MIHVHVDTQLTKRVICYLIGCDFTNGFQALSLVSPQGNPRERFVKHVMLRPISVLAQ